MNQSIPSSFSLDECLKLYSDQIPDFIKAKLEEVLDAEVKLKRQVSLLERESEMREEQLGAAVELVSEISSYVTNSNTRSPKQIRDHIRQLIENSYFEM